MRSEFREKLVSIIMPAYNTEKYISQAIDSILNQTYKNFEFIIVDDGSTDNTCSIIMDYAKKDNRIIIVKRKNMGIVQSLNDAIRLSRGEYIARMDSDDIANIERIEKQVEYMNNHPDIYLLGTNFNLLYEEDMSEASRKRYAGMHQRSKECIDKKNVFLSINEAQKFIHPSVMYKKEVFEIVGMYKEFYMEDIELYFRIAAKGLGIAKLEEDLLTYRAREDSKSWTDSREIATTQLMGIKIDYLIKNTNVQTNMKNYLIWGADISGASALEILNEYFPRCTCKAFIDPYKAGGKVRELDVIKPEEIDYYEWDYIFICTQAGAKSSREYLKGRGKIEIKDFFKIS